EQHVAECLRDAAPRPAPRKVVILAPQDNGDNLLRAAYTLHFTVDRAPLRNAEDRLFRIVFAGEDDDVGGCAFFLPYRSSVVLPKHPVDLSIGAHGLPRTDSPSDGASSVSYLRD